MQTCELCGVVIEDYADRPSRYCRPCYDRWGRYLDRPDQGHRLGDTLTDEACIAILTAMANDGHRCGEDVSWMLAL